MENPRVGPPRTVTGNGLPNFTQPDNTPADSLLPRLEHVRETSPGQWVSRCPAHVDKSPSLSIRQVEDRLLVHCHAGCEPGHVLAAVGLSLADLYNRPLAHHKAPLNRYQRRRHGQAAEALKALVHEINVVWVCAEQMHAGFNLDPDDRDRLTKALSRIKNAERMAA